MVAREDVACWVCLMVGTCFQEAESNLVVRSLQAGCRKSKFVNLRLLMETWCSSRTFLESF